MIREKMIECLQAMPAGTEIYCDDPEETGGAITFDILPELRTIYVYLAGDGVSEWLSINKIDGIKPVRIFQGIVFII